jgi:hypothetical protein
VSTPAPVDAGSTPLPPGTRCGVHPVRRAVDRCPVCSLARCAADAEAAPGGGCASCGGTPIGDTRDALRRPTDAERLVRGALAANGVALLGGVVAAQYVGAQLFAYLTPFVVGVLTGAAAQSASGGARTGGLATRIRAVAAVYAVVGVALGFALEKSQDVVGASTLLPYAAAVVGVVLWTLPPKARPAQESPGSP